MLPYKMKIDLCFSGEEAIEEVKRNLYDLVFMDHMMPKMDGIEATKLIREMGNGNPHYASLPIIALTANAVAGTKEMFLSNGFNDFLSKPIDTARLNVILGRWLPKEKQEKLNADAMEVEVEGLDTKKEVAMLAAFHKDGLKKIREIKKSLETNNYHLYASYMHTLKNSCANLGAYDLSEQAEVLEAAGKQENSKFIDSNNLQFLISLKILLNNIKKVI